MVIRRAFIQKMIRKSLNRMINGHLQISLDEMEKLPNSIRIAPMRMTIFQKFCKQSPENE